MPKKETDMCNRARALAGASIDASDLVVLCATCSGTGKIRHPQWRAWWAEHQVGWQEAIAAEEKPDVPEWHACEVCHDLGYMLTEEGLRIAFVMALLLKDDSFADPTIAKTMQKKIDDSLKKV